MTTRTRSLPTLGALGALGAPSPGRWAGTSILSVKPWSREDLEAVLDVAHRMRTMVELVGSVDLLKGYLLANVFYEPSTRTASSFVAAMERLGGSVVAINEVKYSSVAKGETLEDTIRTLEAYCDVVVLRHPEKGAAQRAANVASRPIINAGDGVGEHPTQALLDLLTIREELGTLDGLDVTMVGDLKHGRTVHSLSRVLSRFDGLRLRLVSPEVLDMPASVLADLERAGVEVGVHRDLGEVVGATDVLYVTRVQKERFADPAAYEAVKHAYVITPDTLSAMKPEARVLHPFPRVGEIDPACDDDPRAAYFRQIACGLYVRMALLAMVLGHA